MWSLEKVLLFIIMGLCIGLQAQDIRGFSYDKFKDASGLLRSSDARENKKNIRLTPAQENRRGGLWYDKAKMMVSDSFEVSFCFRIHGHGGKLGPSGRGGEGLAFVMHNNEIPGKNGEKKSGMGYAGLENCVAIEFDTQDQEDMGRQHVSIQTNGWLANSPDKAASYASHTIDGIDLKDEGLHTARIAYHNPQMVIYVDGQEILSCEMDLTEYLNLDGGAAWVGITAATGAAYSIHEISCFRMEAREARPAYSEAVSGGRELAAGATKRMVVYSKNIRVRLWDINQEDGDLVSLNLNGDWVVNQHLLTNEGHYFDFELDGQLSYLVLHAHNLGEIPPNTAGISVSDGIGEEQEYTLRSNLYSSDALIIEYHKQGAEELDITRKSGQGRKDLKMDTDSKVMEE